MKSTIEVIKEHKKICEEFDYLFNLEPYGGWAQFRGELTLAIQYVINILSNNLIGQDKFRFMEIGLLAGKNFTFLGNIIKLFCDIPTIGIGIDVGTHKFLQANNISLEVAVARWSPQFQYHLVIENSHNQNSLEQTKEILRGKSLDLLFIDGDHSAQGSIKDFQMYGPLVRKGGIIIFDDIMGNAGEVPTTWNKIKKEYKYKEFSLFNDRCGLGVLHYDNRTNECI